MAVRGVLSFLLLFFAFLHFLANGQTTTTSVSGGKCMGDLGCFPITSDFFHPLYRPLNLNPADRESINTTFLIFTQADPKTPFTVRAKDDKLLQASAFNATRKTKIIVHGFIHKVFDEWMLKLKDEYLLNGDHNVVIVDWGSGDGLPYTQATANTRVVAAEISLLLQWLKDSEGLRLEDVHILGHSLGAHIAGYVGHKLAKIGRISAWDPAQPYFQNMPISVRLDPTDADFVDVIHTDTKTVLWFGLGMSQLVGHVDFFPNDGQAQPGCKPDGLFDVVMGGAIKGVKDALGCNHHRAMEFAKASVNRNRCVFTGYACPSWDMFLQGKCADCGPKGDKCAQMGDKAPDHYFKFRDDTVQNKFYLKTGSEAPYCLYHYQVTLQLEDSKTAKDQEGTLTLTLNGKKVKETFQLANGEKVKLYHGASSTFLLTTSTELGDISGATLKWDAGFSIIPWLTRQIHVKGVKVVPMNVVDQRARTAQTRQFCSTEKMNTIESKKEAILKIC